MSQVIFQDPKDTPPPTRVETKDERKERKVYMCTIYLYKL